jgi:uncharacterized protein (UPF0333 family)
MPNSISLHVVKFPDDTVPKGVTSAGVVFGLPIINWDSATAATAAQIAAYPGAATQISVRYWRKNQQLTGTYLVVEAVSAIQTAATTAVPNALQTVHVVQNADGSAAPGSGGAGTIYIIQNSLTDSITAATTAQIATYPNALTQINKRYWSNASQGTGTMIVTEAVAAVLAAS